ncbi:NUDIX domain-containing protein [Clostridium bowmanii]|uniref:bis(5'-nucleosyl)-tetraphosphatase n=1 Tax=Clostridium bowmanii TaxID=132925 RepID=UPI001C0BA4F3|nr:NUDIX domain-containing protein [Clostridium bowmanii]MBU3190466.1 NUDIX domain-containing protein [Clostridium bowmanii]MCA1074472.1 NUDIX domain-containing protein [Clostridium bowmanii]
MNFEKSCGAVIYRSIDENIEFLIVSHRNDGHWGFPKGHVEKNESEEQTARREVFEETGLRVNLIHGFRVPVEYLIKQETMKEVVYFLAQVQDETVNIEVDEIVDYKWSSFQNTKQIISYESSKVVLESALQIITKMHKSPMK